MSSAVSQCATQSMQREVGPIAVQFIQEWLTSVAVGNGLGVPAISLVALAHILGEGELRLAIDGNLPTMLKGALIW
jgi:hypothetical protein